MATIGFNLVKSVTIQSVVLVIFGSVSKKISFLKVIAQKSCTNVLEAAMIKDFSRRITFSRRLVKKGKMMKENKNKMALQKF